MKLKNSSAVYRRLPWLAANEAPELKPRNKAATGLTSSDVSSPGGNGPQEKCKASFTVRKGHFLFRDN
jgi:hypothetical protein